MEPNEKKLKRIFVTVGTTLFDALTESVSGSAFFESISIHGYTHVVIQYGKGSTPSIPMAKTEQKVSNPVETGETTGIYTSSSGHTIHWEIYAFKPSLDKDMSNADLIISHAGAGSIMEGLEKCRLNNSLLNKRTKDSKEETRICQKLVVVINDKLMDNHQIELAEALASRGYLMILTASSLRLEKDEYNHIIGNIETFQPKNFEGGSQTSFGILLDQFMGVDKTS